MSAVQFHSVAAPLLRLQAAALCRGTQALGPLSVSVQPGERIAILGPSGAGKSSLLKMMSGEWPVDAGRCAHNGRTLASVPLAVQCRQRAVLAQGSTLSVGLPAHLVVALGRVARWPDPALHSIVGHAARLTASEHLLDRRFDSLSGGEQARIQLARIFAQLWDARHGLILLDEPLTGLDPGLQLCLLQQIDSYAAQRNHAVIAILHDINQALFHFDRLLLMKAGQLHADRPSHPDALADLEFLYGMCLTCTHDDAGNWAIVPRCPSGDPLGLARCGLVQYAR